MATDPRFFTREHIERSRFNAPASLAEEAVHCLELVAELVEAGLKFQFKGGNSLLLILQEPKRFSIDVDIATDEPRERIEACLTSFTGADRIFKRWEKRQHKTKPWLPIASYYLFFVSRIKGGIESSVMLDVQLRRSPYRTAMKPIACGTLFESPLQTELPLPASIIGDKLLTLGPTTLGIPIGKGKEAQRLKHVFDISRLLATQPSLPSIRESFAACLQHENEIQDRGKSVEEIVQDTLSFCRSIAAFEIAPSEESVSPIVGEIVRGLPAFAGHLFDEGYSWIDLQRDMARVTLCVAAIHREAITDEQFAEAFNPGGISGVGEAARGFRRVKEEICHYWEIYAEWNRTTT
jgi:hypothetical protein